MKKLVLAGVLTVLFMAVPIISFAEEHCGEAKDMCKEMKGPMMCKCFKHPMMEKKIIATQDGGVVIMIGNRLLKYDRDLNLKKEVEIKIDMEDMMKGMKEKHGACEKMMEEGKKE